MSRIPRDRLPDSTIALLADGYEFISKRCDRHGSDLFQTRLLLQKTICMRGEEAARLLYDDDRFQREGAAPAIVRQTLFGEGGVQNLDGATHRHRKRMFMSLMTPQAIQRLTDLMVSQWNAYVAKWKGMDEVELFYQSSEILCRAVCDWTGVPLKESEVELRTSDQLAMIDAPATVGPRQWRGRRARRRSERWMRALIEQVRAGRLGVEEGSALHAVASHRERDGKLLSSRVAAVEMLNLIRPTVAVSRWIVFAALALHENPRIREGLRGADDDGYERFVQEVRRYYPFFPLVAARVRRDFEWNGHRFRKGTLATLDLYGTNRHPALWPEPDRFRPDRFRRWDGSAYDFIPQGGGDFHRHHRCPGEWISIALTRAATRLLVEAMEYEVPEQDLTIRLNRIPAIPASRFRVRGVQRAR